MTIQAGDVLVWDGSDWQVALKPIGAIGTSVCYTRTNLDTAMGTSTIINYPGTAHSKSAWTELTGSALAGNLISIGATVSVNTQDTRTLIDIAKGSAGAEQILVENYPIGSWATSTSAISALKITLPLQINDGDRISARIQGVRTSGSATVGLRVVGSVADVSIGTAVDVIGVNAADSAGIAMSASANTYVELTASTSRDYYAMAAIISASGSTMQATAQKITFATGAAGSEVDLFDSYASTNTSESCFWSPGGETRPTLHPIPLLVSYESFSNNAISYFVHNPFFKKRIPAGTRIAAKIDAASRNYFDASVLGIY
jgi:hypothetical protein